MWPRPPLRLCCWSSLGWLCCTFGLCCGFTSARRLATAPRKSPSRNTRLSLAASGDDHGSDQTPLRSHATPRCSWCVLFSQIPLTFFCWLACQIARVSGPGRGRLSHRAGAEGMGVSRSVQLQAALEMGSRSQLIALGRDRTRAYRDRDRAAGPRTGLAFAPRACPTRRRTATCEVLQLHGFANACVHMRGPRGRPARMRS